MKVGDIVRLKEEHSLKEFFQYNCIIVDISSPVALNSFKRKSKKYHIRTITGELKWTWVYESEVDKISDIRDSILKEIGLV